MWLRQQAREGCGEDWPEHSAFQISPCLTCPAGYIEEPSLADSRTVPCPLLHPHCLSGERKHGQPRAAQDTLFPCNYPNYDLMSQNQQQQSALTPACSHLPPAVLSTPPTPPAIPTWGYSGAPSPAVLFRGRGLPSVRGCGCESAGVRVAGGTERHRL